MAGPHGEWTSEAPTENDSLVPQVLEPGRGADLAVGISLSQDVGPSVLRYVESTNLAVSRFENYLPRSGAQISSIPSVEAGIRLAWALSKALRDATEDLGEGAKLHLFMATPLSVAILIGHLWNRMPPTQLYDDLGRRAPTHRPLPSDLRPCSANDGRSE
jgi:hypothetical protein